MVLLAKLIASYLIGSIVGSLLLGKLRGVDIREQGSGNAGATNALRTQGKLFALGTALIDFGKGVFAAALIAPIGWSAGGTLSLIETQLACGLAAALGHCYPLFHGFRGGKGAGTLFGMLAWLFPWVALVMLGLWLLVLTTTGYVGLGTVIAGIAFPDHPVPDARLARRDPDGTGYRRRAAAGVHPPQQPGAPARRDRASLRARARVGADAGRQILIRPPWNAPDAAKRLVLNPWLTPPHSITTQSPAMPALSPSRSMI